MLLRLPANQTAESYQRLIVSEVPFVYNLDQITFKEYIPAHEVKYLFQIPPEKFTDYLIAHNIVAGALIPLTTPNIFLHPHTVRDAYSEKFLTSIRNELSLLERFTQSSKRINSGLEPSGGN